MGQAKDRETAAIDGRELFGKVQKTRRSPIRDRFGRALEEGDVILSPGLVAMGVPFQIAQIVPATGPQMPPGSYWLDVTCRSRILVQAGISMDDVLLLMPKQEAPKPDEGKPTDAMDADKPGELKTPGGIILSDPDGMSER